MAYSIGGACVDELAGDCVDACPVDCIYQGARKRYINPNECIECGACLPACPVNAITARAAQDAEWAADNERFFSLPLPGYDEAIGDPGGAEDFESPGVDTERVDAM